MNGTPSIRLAALLTALLLVGTAGASAKTLPGCHVPKLTGDSLTAAQKALSRAHCDAGKISGPRSGVVNAQSPKAGRNVKRGAKVRLTFKAKTKTPTQTPAAPAVLTLHVSLDPSFTQNPSNPLQVTYQVSASATTDGGTQTVGDLPDGVLEFFSDGSLADTMNVGGTVTGGPVTITYASYGNHTTDVVYDSGTNSTTTGVETVDIEAPPPAPPSPVATSTTLSLVSLHGAGEDITATLDLTVWTGFDYTTTITDITTEDAVTSPTAGPISGTPSSLSIAESDADGEVDISGLGTVADTDTVCMSATTLATTVQGQPYSASTSAGVQIWPWNGENACS